MAYKEGEALRPVVHRASLVEMAVPYGDPRYGPLLHAFLFFGTRGPGSMTDRGLQRARPVPQGTVAE